MNSSVTTAELGRRNNVWYRRQSGADTVVVFVHGIFSDSRACWTSKPTTPEVEGIFWPDLLVRDKGRLGRLDVFLGGFFTAVDAGHYDIFDCSQELFAALNRPDTAGNPPPMAYQKIVFVCHSTGGIVARHLLVKHRRWFAGKRVGIVLIASPSDGSDLAVMLGKLAELFNAKLAGELATQSPALSALDKDFKDLVHDQARGFDLIGVEAYENRFILHRSWWPFNKARVVPASSAGRYFAAPRHLAQTDHFTAVKPESLDSPQHELLVDFFQRFAGDAPNEKASKEPPPKSTAAADIWFNDLFEPDAVAVTTAISQCRADPDRVSSVSVEWSSGLIEMRDMLDEAVREAQQRIPSPRFAGIERSSVAGFISLAERALARCTDILKGAEARLPHVIRVAAAMTDNDRSSGALSNFLRLCVLNAGQSVAYSATYEPIRDEVARAKWTDYIFAGESRRLGLLFGNGNSTFSARIASVSGYALDPQSGFMYLWGPEGAVMECWDTNAPMYPRSRWFSDWIVPQVEMMMVERGSTDVIEYDGTIVPTGVIKDADGKEVTHPF